MNVGCTAAASSAAAAAAAAPHAAFATARSKRWGLRVGGDGCVRRLPLPSRSIVRHRSALQSAKGKGTRFSPSQRAHRTRIFVALGAMPRSSEYCTPSTPTMTSRGAQGWSSSSPRRSHSSVSSSGAMGSHWK
jgi:hypothetical protein